jgi:hypothetical protein
MNTSLRSRVRRQLVDDPPPVTCARRDFASRMPTIATRGLNPTQTGFGRRRVSGSRCRNPRSDSSRRLVKQRATRRDPFRLALRAWALPVTVHRWWLGNPIRWGTIVRSGVHGMLKPLAPLATVSACVNVSACILSGGLVVVGLPGWKVQK